MCVGGIIKRVLLGIKKSLRIVYMVLYLQFKFSVNRYLKCNFEFQEDQKRRW